MKEWIIRLMLMTLGFVIAIVALEFSLSKFAPNPKTYPTGFWEQDQYIGWKGIPGIEKKWVKGRITSFVKMNSHGFRDKERTYNKEKGTFRILALGDSFTEALQVPIEETFPYILEQRLNSESSKRFEVINLGISGFGTAQEYLTLKHYGLKYHPDLVILEFFIGNDVVDNSIILHPPAEMPFFVQSNGNLEEIPFKMNTWNTSERPLWILPSFFPNIYYWLCDLIQESPSQILREVLPHSLINGIHNIDWLANFLRQIGILKSQPDRKIIPDYLQVYAWAYPPEWQDAWDVTKTLLLKLAKELQSNNIGFLVVVVPNEWEFRSDMRYKILEDPQMRTLIDLQRPELILSNFLQSNKINYFLLRPEFERYIRTSPKMLHFPYKYDHHWNAEGHALTAELIYKKLKDDNLIPIN